MLNFPDGRRDNVAQSVIYTVGPKQLLIFCDLCNQECNGGVVAGDHAVVSGGAAV